MPASAWPSVPLWRVSSMRRDSERISFSIDSIARRGIASVMAARMSASSERNAVIDCSIPSGRCSASIWLVILSRCRSSEEKSGPAGAAGCIGGAIGMRGRHGRPLWAARCAAASAAGAGASSSFWRAAISAIAKSNDAGLSGGEGRYTWLAARSTISAWRCLSWIWACRGGGLEICDSRASRREIASFNCRATPGSPRGTSRAARIAARQIVARHVAARHIAARLGLRNLLDLAGDRIQPLMDVGDVGRLLVRHRRGLIVGALKIGPGGIAEGGIEPVVQRHAGAARGGLGPLAHGWIDAFNTPRYARIHALVRFRLRRATCAFSLPARPDEETIEFRAGRLPQNSTFSCYGK